jgi:tetratricopeptide (TPR) repeat protein
VVIVGVFVAQKKYDEAIQLLQAAAKKDPVRLDYHLTIGNVAVQAAKYDLALQEFLWILNHTDKLSKAAGELYYRIGIIYFRKVELDFSIIFLRQAKDLQPENVVFMNGLAMVLQAAGQKDAAETEYRA